MPNPRLMCYNIENGVILIDTYKCPGKRKRKLLFELEKKKSIKLKRSQKLLEKMNKSSQYNQQTEPQQCSSEVEHMYLPNNLVSCNR